MNNEKIKSIKGLQTKKQTNISRTHIIMDIYKCDDEALAKADVIEERVKSIFSDFNVDIKIHSFYQFEPFGVTAVVYGDGLQFAMHTWPEHRSGAIDLYSLKDRKFALDVAEALKKLFSSGEYQMNVRKR